MILISSVLLLLLLHTSFQTTCYDTQCCTSNSTSGKHEVHEVQEIHRNTVIRAIHGVQGPYVKYCIPCNQSSNHCVLDGHNKLSCEPGSTEAGVQCVTDNRYYHCYCTSDKYGNGYCDCSSAIVFWTVIGVMGALLLITQLSLLCCYCRARRRTGPSTIQVTNYGAVQSAGGVRVHPQPVGGVRVLPEQQQPLIQPELHNEPPPSYLHVVENLPTFVTPPTNPYW